MALSGYDQEELGRIKKRVDDTERALGEGDVDEARGMARQAHEGLQADGDGSARRGGARLDAHAAEAEEERASR